MADLTSFSDRLDVAALRYVRAFRRDDFDHDHETGRITIGTAAPMLIEATSR